MPRSSTTEFDHLMKTAFKIMYPEGSTNAVFRARPFEDCYQKTVKPDFVLAGKPWVDFKLHVSYREKSDVPWRPSALYASLRKYLDHSQNPTQKLTIVYGTLHGSLKDVQFPIMRGSKVLLSHELEFTERIQMLPARLAIRKLDSARYSDLIKRILALTA